MTIITALVITLVLLTAISWFWTWGKRYRPTFDQEEPVFCPATSPTLSPGFEIKVMTWNVQFMAGKNYTFFFDVPNFRGVDRRPSPEDITSTIEEVARVIREENPDVVLLQEVDEGSKRTDYHDQIVRLLDKLPPHTYCYTSTFYWKAPFIPHPKIWGSMGLKLGIISKYKISKAIRRKISNLPVSALVKHLLAQRAILEARLPISDGREFVVANTHLEAFVAGTTVMEDQITDVSRYLQNLEASRNYWVFGGDLNLVPEGQYEALVPAQRVYYNPKTEIAALYERFNVIPGADDLSKKTSEWLTYFSNDPTITAPDRTLDYILYSQRLSLVRKHVRMHDTMKISDHFPVIAVYKI